MKRIETVQEALAAANQALDIVMAIQAAKIRVIVADDAIDVSLACARSDLAFLSRALESKQTRSTHTDQRCPGGIDGFVCCPDCAHPNRTRCSGCSDLAPLENGK